MRCGTSSWYMRREFLEENLKIIRRLSYIAADSIKVIDIDHEWVMVAADHEL